MDEIYQRSNQVIQIGWIMTHFQPSLLPSNPSTAAVAQPTMNLGYGKINFQFSSVAFEPLAID